MFASEKNKLIAAGLALTLFGGVVGAYTTRTKTPTPETTAPTTATAPLATPAPQPPLPETQPLTTAATTQNPTGQPTILQLPPGQAYQITPIDGTQVAQTSTYEPAPRRQTSRRSSRTYTRTSSPQRTYYTYEEAPKKRSFWSRHGRDILTIGAGTGLGAGIGALAGGKKGAAIGALAGGGGSALYTYGIRKRN